jgi:hypothetical protein
MAKLPIDESSLLKAINEAMSAAGMSLGQKEIRSALKAVREPIGRKVPKITAKTAAGGAGKKPPKPPKISAAAPTPKPKGPKKPIGPKPSDVASKLTRAQKREANVAAHWAGREKYLADSSAAAKARKAETRAQNQAAWAKRQDEMEARRMAGREKYNKKKNQGK